MPARTAQTQHVSRDEVQYRLGKMRTIAGIMDSQFNLFGIRVGFDAIIGLIPGFGDALGGFIALYLVWQAYLMGMPSQLIGSMLTNIVIDVIVGGVPVVGDLFDVFFKVNNRNLRLAEDYVAQMFPNTQDV